VIGEIKRRTFAATRYRFTRNPIYLGMFLGLIGVTRSGPTNDFSRKSKTQLTTAFHDFFCGYKSIRFDQHIEHRLRSVSALMYKCRRGPGSPEIKGQQ
jgi:hypothetical protein